jgi:nicotinate-nucleotide--dimethylbenzimidazole phosphoribosyltransferase
MRTHLAAATIAVGSLLAVAACDSRDYEAEIATLEGDLESARSENEQIQTELEELRTQAEAQPAMPEEARENVQAQLNTVVQTAAQSFERAGSTEQGASAEEGAAAVRTDMQLIVQSAQAAAQDLGVELETVAMDTDAGATEGMPEPAAGPDAQQQEPAATPEEEPAATPEEQPADEEQQPAAQ